MKRILLAISFCFLSHVALGDSYVVDSLIMQLSKVRGAQKVELLNQIAFHSRYESYETTAKYATMAIEYARRLGDQKSQADALLHIGSACFFVSKHSEAIDYLQQSLAIREMLGDTMMMLDALKKISSNYRMIGHFELSLEYLLRGLRLRESTGGAVSTGPLLHSIGDVYYHLNNFPIALEYYKRAFLFFKQAGIKRGISQTSINIGNIYKLTGNYLQALEYYRLALEIDREFGYQQEVSESLNNIALIHVRLNQPAEAIAAFTEALEIAGKKNNIHNQIVALKGLGNLYADNRDFSRSEQSLYQALKLAQQNENRNDLMEIYQSLALIYSKAGNFQRAYEHQVEYTRLNNQIYDVNSRLISEIEARYELEKHKQQLDAVIKESEINELQLRKSQMIVYGVSVLLLTIIIIALLLVRQNRLNMRQKVINLEQKLFRSQMNPHFIYNALGAIQSFMYKRETAEAGKYLSNFAKLMRLVLNNSRAEYVTLENEIQTLGYYIELQRMRFDNKFDYQFEVDSKINPSVICIPPMLAQPLIENSVEHGIQHLSTKGLISIRFKLNNGTVLFEIEDNGIGIAKSKQNQKSNHDHESLAISITEERLRLLNRKQSNKIQLKISECQNALGETVGTRITFNIPYIIPANNNNNVMFAAKAI